ncbi:Ferredoxin [uncultured Roseburia sp.]|uniref:ASKHA domain-containing protein n=1 Tax=Brotonthovivens ammoniilytica TaxID=2981725 RepID=A0ABT2TL20_9FIRM|nr:ASKHA domain-containing protein [Brotonthovivens ammoniilytica]MCU6762907.1 ASKHA domain-containing protein [Brotonthovivens ammoniilytica]SCI93366.1 Ferredoxin [uncultured Roseburia sp.]
MENYNVCVTRNGVQKQIEIKRGESLLDAFIRNDIYISASCGGAGKCGKCGVKITEGSTEITDMDRKFFSEEELKDGWRLSCLSYPAGECSVVIETGDESDFEIVSDYQERSDDTQRSIEEAYDIGIDIGTTTIALNLIGAKSKKVCGTYTTINRQRAYGADVISRIQAANDGKLKELTNSIRRDLYDGILQVLEEGAAAPQKLRQIVIAGNTTMGHLLMGYSCETLGVFPFTPVNIGTIYCTFEELFGGAERGFADVKITLLPGISTYVGADISAGMLSCGMDRAKKPCLLLDLGTNGEMGLGNCEKIMVTSTAAGPAFEGGNISCGMGSVKGAICGVEIKDGEVHVKTIGHQAPIGLCGTGVIETVNELLREELIDETGMLDEDYFDDGYLLAKKADGEKITFTQQDVREIQLAKSAVRAGVETLLLRYGIGYDEVDQVYLAGGFGYKINLEKAIGIGLLPEELHDKITAVGNSSLGGTVTYLTQDDAQERMEHIIETSEEIALSTDKDFNRFYTDYMFFE